MSPSRRVAVSHPRTVAARRVRQDRPAIRELDEQSGVGEVLVRSLVRAQLRAGLGVLTVFATMFGGLAMMIYLSDDFGGARLAGLPWTWVLLGPPSYVVIFGLAVAYRRMADRNEADFVELVERREP